MISRQIVIDFLNTIDPVISAIQNLSALAPFIDEASIEDKAKLGIALLGLINEKACQLACMSDCFTDTCVNRKPRQGAFPVF